MNSGVNCPVCNREFEQGTIEDHVNKCLFLNTPTELNKTTKRSGSHSVSPCEKKLKFGTDSDFEARVKKNEVEVAGSKSKVTMENGCTLSIPLAEQMRPLIIDDIVGHKESLGPGSMLRSMLEQKKIPNMILFGPPGCGKTSLANVIAKICREQNTLRYVKLSATIAGINDVKEVVKIAKNEAQYKRQTVLFMDEIHRFNKLQQDTFLPHVENGTIILVGATTENPSFSLNNALLSRCRVVVLEKLSVDNVLLILERALNKNKEVVVAKRSNSVDTASYKRDGIKFIIEHASLRWLAEVCDGDARVALGALELTISASSPDSNQPVLLNLDDIKNGIKRTHMLYDRKGEEHYNVVSAIHKSIRAGDDNAALYWTVRAMHGGEDPLYIARRLVRAACEDIGLGDSSALVEAMACLQGCQQIGMPECDVLLAQCAVRLARAPKSTEVYHAMKRCQRALNTVKGPMPSVPLHLRNAPTSLMKQMGYGVGYNTRHKDTSGLCYMPEGMENVNFFRTTQGDPVD